MAVPPRTRGDDSIVSSEMPDEMSGASGLLWRNCTVSGLLQDQDGSSQTGPTQPTMFQLLPSGGRYRVLRAQTNRLSSSYFHEAIGVLNLDLTV